MKKFLLTVLLSGAAISAFSQYTLPNKTTFGFKGGVNIANAEYTVQDMDGSYSFNSLTGFSAGVFADLVVTPNFSIQPGLYYTIKGLQINRTEINGEILPGLTASISAQEKDRIAYAELPLHFLYNGSIASGKFFIGAGPYAASAITARTKGAATLSITMGNDTQSKTEEVDEKLEIDKEDGIKRFDYGATALAGFRFNSGLLFSAGFDYGMNNVNYNADGNKLKTRTFNVSVGFSF